MAHFQIHAGKEPIVSEVHPLPEVSCYVLRLTVAGETVTIFVDTVAQIEALSAQLNTCLLRPRLWDLDNHDTLDLPPDFKEAQ